MALTGFAESMTQPPSYALPFYLSCVALSQANARVINKFCAERDWIRNLAVDPATASNTSVCLTLDLEKDQVRAMSLRRSMFGFDALVSRTSRTGRPCRAVQHTTRAATSRAC